MIPGSNPGDRTNSPFTFFGFQVKTKEFLDAEKT